MDVLLPGAEVDQLSPFLEATHEPHVVQGGKTIAHPSRRRGRVELGKLTRGCSGAARDERERLLQRVVERPNDSRLVASVVDPDACGMVLQHEVQLVKAVCRDISKKRKQLELLRPEGPERGVEVRSRDKLNSLKIEHHPLTDGSFARGVTERRRVLLSARPTRQDLSPDYRSNEHARLINHHH